MTLNLSAFFEKNIITIISDYKSAIQNERRTRQRQTYRKKLHNGGSSPRMSPSPRCQTTLHTTQSSLQNMIWNHHNVLLLFPYWTLFFGYYFYLPNQKLINSFLCCLFELPILNSALSAQKGSTSQGRCQNLKSPRPQPRIILRDHIRVRLRTVHHAVMFHCKPPVSLSPHIFVLFINASDSFSYM